MISRGHVAQVEVKRAVSSGESSHVFRLKHRLLVCKAKIMLREQLERWAEWQWPGMWPDRRMLFVIDGPTLQWEWGSGALSVTWRKSNSSAPFHLKLRLGSSLPRSRAIERCRIFGQVTISDHFNFLVTNDCESRMSKKVMVASARHDCITKFEVTEFRWSLAEFFVQQNASRKL